MELRPQRYRLSLKLSSVFFPLTVPDVFNSLRTRGFETAHPPAPIPTGPRVYLSGPIARKHDCSIDIDNDRNLVGCDGASLENTLQTFSELLSMLNEDFLVDLDKEVSYAELIANLLIVSDKNPLLIMQKMSAGTKHIKEVSNILGTDVADYRMSIVPKGILPASRKWFEINITPRITMPTKSYWVEVVFRNEVIEETLTFARNLNSTISNIINAIERG